MPGSNLTLKQEAFVAAYLGEANGNATEAARMAGYAVPMQEGYRLLRNAEIVARVQKKVDEYGMTAAEVLQELASVAKADWKDFVRVTGRAKNGEATGVQSDISSKVKALELLGKYHQLFIDRQDVNINVREHRIGVPQSALDRLFRPAETITEVPAVELPEEVGVR